MNAYRLIPKLVSVALALMCVMQHPCDAQSNIESAIAIQNGRIDERFEVILGVKPKIVQRGGQIVVRCAVKAVTRVDKVYNPFLWEAYALPAQIVIRSSDGKFSRNLLRHVKVDSPEVMSEISVSPEIGATLGREFHVEIAREVSAERPYFSNTKSLDLPLGEYFIQVVYNKFLTRGPQNLTATTEEPLAISEPQKFVVTASSNSATNTLRRDDSPFRLELRPKIAKVVFAREGKVELEMTNQSLKMIEVFNPMLSPFLMARQRAVELTVLTDEGKSLGDLIVFHGGSTGLPNSRDWIALPPGGTVSSDITFSLGDIPDSGLIGVDYLVPGKYWLESRAHQPLTSGPPLSMRRAANIEDPLGHPAYEEWRRSFPGPEICRSNRIELEILPRTGD